MLPVTVRFARPLMNRIEAIQAKRSGLDGADKRQLVREAVAIGTAMLEKRTQ